jgi:predicted RNA-binding Zn-ribbon protein involved in translation (DUF1610 family)
VKTANCTSCGAPVTFRSAASVLAVCDYCKSTLIRHDLDLENLGKMAELMEDASPLQRGAEGRYKGGHFTIIGRIQLRYPDGIWNEWHLLFDNQNTGWLSEASGQYVLTFPATVSDTLPAFDDIRLGHAVSLLGESFQVANKESATCIAGEGELPFQVGAGYAAPVIDLTNERNFASIDYSETPPRVFIGEQVQLADLRMTGLKKRAAGKVQIKTFNCPSCAAPLTIRAKGTESVACGNCGSVVDAANENHKILSRFNARVTHEPLLPLGSHGHLHGADYDVVGYLRRQVEVEGLPYEWGEYLLYSDDEGFRWLTEYQGHWSFLKTTNRHPKMLFTGKPVANFLGTRYEHFQTAVAKVTYVLGEFYWRVKVGEQATVMDYVAPPYILSAESTAKEKVWSVGEYVAPEVIEAAFQPAKGLPWRVGVAPNQPSPWLVRPYWKAFGLFVLVALIIQFGFLIFSQQRSVYQNFFELDPGNRTALTTEVFAVPGSTGNLVLRSRTSLDNDWLYLDMQLVEKDTGRHYEFGREISYYHGVDGGEAWSEGDPQDEVVLSAVPAGQYYLEIAPEMESRFQARPVTFQLEVVRDVPSWMNFLIALLGLSTFPLFIWWRKASFEARRWAESDYAPTDDDDE